MKFSVSLICVLTYLAGSWFNRADADVIGFEAGVNYWSHSMSGEVRSPVADNNFVRIDFDDENDFNFFVTLEHPVPFLPNVKIQQNNIQSAGPVPLSDREFLGGQAIDVAGDIDLSHTDLMLYYEVLDNWVNLDLGLSAKYFNGYSQFNYPNLIDDRADFDDWIPMLYAKAQFDLPLTGLSAAAALEALTFDDNDVVDLDLALKYQTKLGLGAALGYRTMDIDLKNINSFRSDLKVDGFYLGMYVDF